MRSLFQRRTRKRAWLAVLAALAVLLAPAAHAVHLVLEPHLYCAEHGHFEAHGVPETDDGDAPADRGEHDDEDTVCLLVLAAGGGEEASPVQPSAAERISCAAVQVLAVGSPAPMAAIAYAPKHSPPDSPEA